MKEKTNNTYSGAYIHLKFCSPCAYLRFHAPEVLTLIKSFDMRQTMACFSAPGKFWFVLRDSTECYCSNSTLIFIFLCDHNIIKLKQFCFQCLILVLLEQTHVLVLYQFSRMFNQLYLFTLQFVQMVADIEIACVQLSLWEPNMLAFFSH